MPENVVYITGADEIAHEFANAPRQLLPTALLRAGTAGGKVLRDAIAALTPVDQGHLKADLDVVVTLDSEFRGIVVDVGFGDLGYIARFVEYGHKIMSHKWRRGPKGSDELSRLLRSKGLTKLAAKRERVRVSQRELGVAAPRPFIRPAASAAEEAVVDAFTETLLDELTQRGFVDG